MKCRPSSLASIATWQTGQGLDASGGLGRGSRFMIENDRQPHLTVNCGGLRT